MPEYCFSLIRRFSSCKTRIEDSVLTQEYSCQRKSVFWYILSMSLHKKCSFPLTISSVNVTKSAVSCEFGHIY